MDVRRQNRQEATPLSPVLVPRVCPCPDLGSEPSELHPCPSSLRFQVNSVPECIFAESSRTLVCPGHGQH